jgi:signal recognition particle GTPase
MPGFRLTYNKYDEAAKNMKVKELTVEEFKALIQEAVEEKLEEMTGDPDVGLELREEIKERLRSSLAAAQRGEKPIPIEQVARQAGLDW